MALDPSMKKVIENEMPDWLKGPMPQDAGAQANSQALAAKTMSSALTKDPSLSSLVQGNIAKTGVTAQNAFGQNAVQPLGYNPNSAPSTVPGGTPVTPGPAAPLANRLPSDTNMGRSIQNYTGPTLDRAAINGRASRDARMQLDALRQQANTGANRFKSEGTSQIDALHAMFAPQYAQNQQATDMASRSALQTQASRGFLVSGMAENAQRQAMLSGERDRMGLAAQETGQVGQIQNRISQSQQELQDTLNSLSGREQDLTGQLADKYSQQDFNNGLQVNQLNSQNTLAMMGMDNSYNQFMGNLNWDKDKFGQTMGFQQSQANTQNDLNNRSLAEQIAARQSGNQLSRDQMNQQNQQWQGDNTLQRDQMGQQNNQFNTEWTNRNNWQNSDNSFRDRQLTEQTAAREQSANDPLGWARLNAEKGWHQQDAALNERGLNMSEKNATADWMTQTDTLTARAKSGDPAALQALGIQDPSQFNVNTLLNYYGSKSPLISSEGANYNSLIDYIYSRNGAQRPSTLSPGPLKDQSSLLDPFGYTRRGK
jgi:hypothetical protein